LSLLHIDSDLYSSAHTVLQSLGDRIRNGTIIVFDELVNFPAYREQEFRALYEFLNIEGGRKAEWIGSMCPARVVASTNYSDWGPCCAVALRMLE